MWAMAKKKWLSGEVTCPTVRKRFNAAGTHKQGGGGVQDADPGWLSVNV